MKQDLQAQLVHELVVESLEGLDAFDHELLAFESGGQSGSDTWNNAFRVIHTIKGSSGCVGFGKVEAIAHTGENLLSVLREGRLTASPRIVSSLLRYSDALREMMRSIEQEGTEGTTDHSVLVEDLRALHAGLTGDASAPESFGFFDDDVAQSAPIATSPAGAPAERERAERADPGKALPASAEVQHARSSSDTAIRVDVGQIDRLMNLVGELVLARNQIVQTTGKESDPAHFAAVQRINLITGELQESVMKTRMQPIGTVWSKFPRIVRDLSHELGKDVVLTMEGSDTEMDRTIIEAIKDPMTHIVRNAIDHGIELPEGRGAAGKGPQGRLSLRAFHEGGQVNIVIQDDGKGIDADRVLQKAMQKGLVSAEQGATMSRRERLALIFLPGLSTAAKVTNVSGRGVGMDVVRNNIQKIGGNVEISSEHGKGASIRIKIPLTLAIIPALIVTCGGERYAIPAACLVELVRIEGDDVATAVEAIHNAPVYRLRGNLLPLVHLAGELLLTARRKPDEAMFLIVLQAEGRQFGLVVDSIHDTEEIVVKPLGKEMKGLSVYAGATIMGDGRVALILDVIGLARQARLLEESRGQPMSAERAGLDADAPELQSLLVARVGRNRVAIPLSCIARLEEISTAQIEFAGKSEVVQYRGRIMTLARLGAMLNVSHGTGLRERESETLPVVVCALESGNLGVIVDAIEDIVEERIQVEVRDGRRGIVGSAIVREQVTDLLDVQELARMAA